MTYDYRKKWLAMLSVILLAFAGFTDYMIVATALPKIQSEFHMTITHLQWVLNIYILALCSFMVIIGHLGDMYGKKRMFYLVVTVFGVASIGAAYAPSGNWLIAYRGIQGIMAAGLFPLSATLIASAFPPNEQGKALAWYGSLTGIAITIGPVIGGAIITYLNWRWIFLINVPIILVGFIFAGIFLRDLPETTKKEKIDFKGFVLLVAGICSLVYGIIYGEELNWHGTGYVLYILAGLVLLISLYFVEKNEQSPIIDFNFFKHPSFLSSATTCFVTGAVVAYALFINPLFLHNIQGDSPMQVGLLLFAISFMIVVCSPIIGKFIDRTGPKIILFYGSIFMLLASIMQQLFNVNSPNWYLILTYIVLGTGWSSVNSSSATAAVAATTPDRAGNATGSAWTLFNVGSAIGLALCVVVFHMIEKAKLIADLKTAGIALNPQHLEVVKTLIADPDKAKQALASLGVNNAHEIFPLFKQSFVSGLQVSSWVLIALAALGILVNAYALRKKIN